MIPCTTDPAAWDYELDGETTDERDFRLHFSAKACQKCPALRTCTAEPGTTGVVAGRIIAPEPRPGRAKTTRPDPYFDQPHGTTAGYDLGCRCYSCRYAQSAWLRRLRRRAA